MRKMVCQLVRVVTIGTAAGLVGCGTMPGPGKGPRPVVYAHGRNPCVEYAEDIFGRRYCRRHYQD